MKYRSRFEIASGILNVALAENATKTRLMYGSYLSSPNQRVPDLPVDKCADNERRGDPHIRAHGEGPALPSHIRGPVQADSSWRNDSGRLKSKSRIIFSPRLRYPPTHMKRLGSQLVGLSGMVDRSPLFVFLGLAQHPCHVVSTRSMKTKPNNVHSALQDLLVAEGARYIALPGRISHVCSIIIAH